MSEKEILEQLLKKIAALAVQITTIEEKVQALTIESELIYFNTEHIKYEIN